MNVCIVGGGNIGTTLACYIKHHNQNFSVSIYTRRPDQFTQIIKCNDWEGGFSFEERLDCISNDPSVAAAHANIVFIALPHFAVEKAFADIAPYVSCDAYIGVLPGGGGCEFFFNKYFSSKQTLFGFQRVPFTAKLEKYGRETNLKSWKPFSVVGTQRKERADSACELIQLCGLKTKKAPNYLSIALTPTNPILHTSRTYELFGSHDKNYIYPEKLKFYVGWTDEASHTMLAMDSELHDLLNHIEEIDTSSILPLTEHYEAPTIQDMTRKINSIPTFQSVYAPMIKANDNSGFITDVSSRMFTEDFPWGLAIIRSYFSIFGVKAPTMDILLNWYSQYMGYDWYSDGLFCGKDLKNTGVIQNYGIQSITDVIECYE